MDFEKPYGFTLEGWERLFVEGQLPLDRPAGMVIEEYACSFIDRHRIHDVAYVRSDLEKECEKS